MYFLFFASFKQKHRWKTNFDSSFGNLFSRSLLSFYLVIVFLNTHDKAMFTKKNQGAECQGNERMGVDDNRMMTEVGMEDNLTKE